MVPRGKHRSIAAINATPGAAKDFRMKIIVLPADCSYV